MVVISSNVSSGSVRTSQRAEHTKKRAVLLHFMKVCRVMEVHLLPVVACDQRSTVPWPQLLPHTEAVCDSVTLRVLVHIKRILLFIIS